MNRGTRTASLHFSLGFTIVETMIVLAVTGGLFVAIAATLPAHQNAAEFIHATQSIQVQLQEVMTQASQGYYPHNADFDCTATLSGPSFTIGTAGQGTNALGNVTGTNTGCILLGKMVQFAVWNTGSTNPEAYRVYTIAGLLSAVSSGGTNPFINAKPAVVGIAPDYVSYSDTNALQYGLRTRYLKAVLAGGATVNLEAVGFLMEPGSLASSGATYNSGVQQVDLVGVPGVSTNQTILGAVNVINTMLNSVSAVVNPPGGVQVCFVNGSTNQSALMTIGSSGRQLSIKVDIKGNTTCT